MARSSSTASPANPGLHPRNLHRDGYDFFALVAASPRMAPFVRRNPIGTATIDFADPAAVLALNQALLTHHYGITKWDLPPGALCPPIPGRADYLHHLADLLAGLGRPVPQGSDARILDIGVGANCIYPILGTRLYGWSFVGSDIDPAAIEWANRLAAAHPTLAGRIELRLQRSRRDIFHGVVRRGETFAASLCNPPFHASREEALAGSQRKVRNLHGHAAARRPVLNFGGQGNELWCAGGEAAFIRRMILESARQPSLCRWFTTLVAKRENLPAIERTLKHVAPTEVRTIDMAQGQKKSRILAWRF